jgi:cytochrome P450
MPLIASANRDISQFANADVFDINRPKIKQHFTFGHGIHTCIGAALARAELRIALEVMLSKFTQFICPADDQLLWKDSMFVRGVSALPVTFR